jgi:regulator of sigma E protease
MKQITEATLKGLGTALGGLAKGDTQQASSQVSGVVGIGYIIGQGSSLGLQFILLIIAIISLTLAIMNILPIPALDGGRLFVTLFFHATKQPLTQRKEEWIHGTGFVLLMVLFVLITIVDISRFT